MLSALIVSLANLRAHACTPHARKTKSASPSHSSPEVSCGSCNASSGSATSARMMPAHPRRLALSFRMSHDIRIVTTGESEMMGKMR
jgi:hypothetical protein